MRRLVEDFIVQAAVEARLGDGVAHDAYAIRSHDPRLRRLIERLDIESVEFWKFFRILAALAVRVLVCAGPADLLHGYGT